MTDASDELRALLARERETDRPPQAVVEHGWARLEAAARAGLPPDPALDVEIDAAIDTTAPAAKGAAITTTKLGVVVAAVVAGGVATWAVTRDAAEPPASPTVTDTETEHRAATPPVMSEIDRDEADRSEALEPPTGSRDAEPQRSPKEEAENEPRPRPPAPTKPSTDREPADALAAELHLVETARRALATKDPKRALELARRHARLHPAGVLAEERRAIEALALCELGRPRAHEVALGFQRDYPRSTHIDRVRAACSPPDDATPQEDEP